MSDATTKPESTEMTELAQAQKQRDEYLAQLQRERADFANYQKRAKAQADIDRQYAVASLATDLLAVIDNFERATEVARTSGAKPIVEGLDIVHKLFLDVLAKHGVEPIAAMGQPFDPNQHEAMMLHPNAEHPENTVVMELGKGYKHHDRILRPSRVAVSTKPTE